MLYETHLQWAEFMVMLVTGMALGAVGMVFRLIRGVLDARCVLSLVCDAVMGAVWGAIFCAGLTLANRGELRLFHVCSAGAGAALFQAAIGIPVCDIGAKCRRRCGMICQKLCQLRLIKALLR